MDFTLKKYQELLMTLSNQNYTFQTFKEFIQNQEGRSIVLRHDVDLLPDHSLRFAKIQNDFGIQGTYYFRAVPESWNEKVIIEISNLGHEVGYHYENLASCNGDMLNAIEDFKINLENLREIAPVSTICMHGSPRSKYDSKDLWKEFDYRDYGIIGEPYFDIDFDKVFYLTDTGRMWDGHKVSVRDKVNSSFKQTYHTTGQLIGAIKKNELVDQVMFTFHPQRWHEDKLLWIKELFLQNTKNVIKKHLLIKSKG